MGRHEVQHFHKSSKKYETDLIIGIDDNPPDARNAMFYVRMKSIRKESGRKDRAREIWLSNKELKKLGVLMTIASRFWRKHTLAKNTVHTQKRIEEFIEKWEMKRASLA